MSRKERLVYWNNIWSAISPNLWKAFWPNYETKGGNQLRKMEQTQLNSWILKLTQSQTVLSAFFDWQPLNKGKSTKFMFRKELWKDIRGWYS